ncbi:MAG: lactonase family protein [Terriglobales bacterium]
MKNRRAAACLGLIAVLLVGAVLFGCGSSSRLHIPKFLVALDETEFGIFAPAASGIANVNVFSVNPATGELTLVSTSPQDVNLYQGGPITVHPNGHWLYAGDWDNGMIHAWNIDAAGLITETNSEGVEAYPGWVGGLAVTEDGKYLYSATSFAGYVVIWSINQSTGAVSFVDAYDTGMSSTGDITIAGNFLYTSTTCFDETTPSVHAAKIETDGSLTPISTTAVEGAGYCFWSVQVDRSGKFLVAGDENATLFGFNINPTTGDISPTAQGSVTYNTECCDVRAITFSPDNKFLYTTDDDYGPHAFSFNETTGAMTELDNSPYGEPISYANCQIVADPSNQFVYLATGSEVVGYTRNQTTGDLTSGTEYFTENDSACGIVVTY